MVDGRRSGGRRSLGRGRSPDRPPYLRIARRPGGDDRSNARVDPSAPRTRGERVKTTSRIRRYAHDLADGRARTRDPLAEGALDSLAIEALISYLEREFG